MKYKKAILYGIGIWAVVLLAAMLLYPIRMSDRVLFESVIPVVLVAAVMLASVHYILSLKTVHRGYGLILGMIFLFVSFALDTLVFSWGPMKMSFVGYLKDIGVTYLLMPIITMGVAFTEEQLAEAK